jgi:geranylgeranyl diphosphate synthase type II
LDTRAWLAERLPPFERALESALALDDTVPPQLRDAMGHLLFPGGKRLRPALALAAAEAMGTGSAAAVPMGMAVELVHTYSLIHDDLPCMDDDDLRRGRPTVHKAFGESTAVLAGDALLTLAFGVLAEAPATAEARIAATAELARAAGAAGLVGGQVDDLAFDSAHADVAAVESVHARKSAALIAASIAGGACLAGADPARADALRCAGNQLGVAFQIADDLLDSDEDDGCTLLRVLDPPAARARAEALLAQVLEAFDSFGEEAEPLRGLARYAVRREE